MFKLQEAKAEIHIAEMPNIIGNTTQINQLFANLIDNAIKYKSDQPLIIDISARDTGSLWEISIKDNGIGIAEEHQSNVFNMFKQLDSRTHCDSSGVGLAICKKIVKAHDGDIFVRSNSAGGCDFVFTLPKISKMKNAAT
ncbi:MAG: ATP-binding protein [Pseudomonadota bacterium]